MDIDRDDLVKQLRDDGHHDKADKAEKQLPKKVTKDDHKGRCSKRSASMIRSSTRSPVALGTRSSNAQVLT